MRQTNPLFTKGLNRRIDIERSDDPNRLYTLQNARLFKRGESGFVSRIEGYETLPVTNDLSNVLDIIAFQDFIVLLYSAVDYNQGFTIEIRDQEGVLVETFSYIAPAATYGKFVIQEDTLFVAPHNKQINYIEGVWHLNDFISTTPLIEIDTNVDDGVIATGTITVTGDSSPALAVAARAYIDVIDNAPVAGATFKIAIDSVLTADIVIADNTVTPANIALAIQTAVNDGVTGIAGWTASVSTNRVTLTADTAGTAFNNLSVEYTTAGLVYEFMEFGNFETAFTNPTSTTTAGGKEAGDSLGVISLLFQGLDVTVTTGDVLPALTAIQVAGLIETALTNSVINDTYSISRVNAVITLTADFPGTEYNSSIVINPNDTGVTATTTNLAGGQAPIGNLSQFEYYWYRVRYVYRDGHLTKSSFPALVNTSLFKTVNLTVTVEEDLDGGYAEIEVFRKREGENFFLIDRVKPTAADTIIITDNGKAPIGGFDEQNYLWTDTHKTNEIVRDRLVRANLTYPEREFTSNGTGLSLVANTDENELPLGSLLNVYNKVRFADGTESLFQSVGSISVDTEERVLQVNQTQDITSEQDIKEVAYYGLYSGERSQNVLDYNSVEINNPNIGSIADVDTAPGEEELFTNTRLFLGFRYINVRYYQLAGERFGFIKDLDWNTNTTGVITIQYESGLATNLTLEQAIDRTVTVSYFGNTYTYVRKYASTSGGIDITDPLFHWGVYELADYKGIRDSIASGRVKAKIVNTNQGNLSDNYNNDEIFGAEVTVSALIDTSSSVEISGLNGGVSVQAPETCRLYISFPRNEVLDSINNPNLNRTELSYDHANSSINLNTFTFSYQLLNLRQYETAQYTPYTTGNLSPDGGLLVPFSSTQYVIYNWRKRFFVSDPNLFDVTGAVVYFGTKENEVSTHTFTHVGYFRDTLGDAIFYALQPHNIFETLVQSKDFIFKQQVFPNQIIWSEPFILGANLSGTRNFSFDNFLNVSQDYGQILDIQYIRNHLLVFTQRGVARINVGEVLTQTPQGETFVDSSRFLNSPFWLLKNLPAVKADSIVQYENRLYFSDGRDVWMYEEGFTNITGGAVALAGDARHYGSIDPKNNEYRISDGTNTFAYGFETGEWCGPYTYQDKDSTLQHLRMWSVVGADLVEHNIGNTFGVSNYDTIVESIANDLGEASVDKFYRKFYLDTSDSAADFSYSKDYTNWNDIDMTARSRRGGLFNIGIAPAWNTARKLYWKIQSAAQGFVLKLISFEWQPKQRR